MAKKSRIERNNRLKTTCERYEGKRRILCKRAHNKSLSLRERADAQSKLFYMLRDSSSTRVRNRCAITGYPRSFYRMFHMSRHCVRDFASKGSLPGVLKHSF